MYLMALTGHATPTSSGEVTTASLAFPLLTE